MGNILQIINARMGRVRREVLNGKNHLVAPFVSITSLLLLSGVTTAGLGSLPNVGSLTNCPVVSSVQGSLQGETNMSKLIQKYGVYCLLNTVNQKRYVGSGSGKRGIEGRTTGHIKLLRANKHGNRHLQAAWNKYGESNFQILTIEACSPSWCIRREQYWIDYYNADNPEYGYNICPKAGNTLGIKFSEEACKKISDKAKGRVWTPEAKAKLSKTLKGHPVSDKARKAMNWTGRKHSEETKLKLSQYVRTAEHRANMSAGGKKKRLSEEHKRKISDAGRRQVQSEETKSKRRGQKRTEETKANMRVAWQRRKSQG